MKKSILILAGRRETGKSHTLNLVWNMLRSSFRAAPFHIREDDGDILATIIINDIKVGIESQGDPESRMFKTLEKLMSSSDKELGSCDIVICASRTRGTTKELVIELSDRYGYHRLWNGAPITDSHNISKKNELCADFIFSEVLELIKGSL